MEHYAVVGYLENLPAFYEALELALPDWFKGISRVYHGKVEANKDKLYVTPRGNKTLSQVNTKKMRSVLWSEYELYHFIQQRLHFILKQLKTNLV